MLSIPAYQVRGAAIVESEIDVLRGTYDIRNVKLVHDLGRPINELVDLDQIEGGLAQGIGWMTLEELAYGDDGRILSHANGTANNGNTNDAGSINNDDGPIDNSNDADMHSADEFDQDGAVDDSPSDDTSSNDQTITGEGGGCASPGLGVTWLALLFGLLGLSRRICMN